MIASHPAVTAQAAVLESHMEMDIISDLARWVADQVRRGAERFVLLQRGDSHQVVDEWLADEMDTVHTLAYAIHATGVREAQTSREPVSFIIFSMRPGSSSAASRYSFRVEMSGSGRASGSADEKGILALMMSHTEMAARLSLGNARDIVEQYQKLLDQSTKHLTLTLEQAHARIRVLEARENEWLDLREKLLSVAADRDIRIEEVKGKFALQEKAIEKLGPITIAGLTKLLGSATVAALGLGGAPANEAAAEGAPGGATAPPPPDPEATTIADLLGALIASMTKDQMERLFGVLRPDQLQVFLKIYELSEARTQRKSTTASPGATAESAAPAANTAEAPSTPPTTEPPPPTTSTQTPPPTSAGTSRDDGPSAVSSPTPAPTETPKAAPGKGDAAPSSRRAATHRSSSKPGLRRS